MRLYGVSAVLCVAVARARSGESIRAREKQRETLLAALPPEHREAITEMRTQGHPAALIIEQLGLPHSEADVEVIIAALDLDGSKHLRRPQTIATPASKRRRAEASLPAQQLADHHRAQRKQKRKTTDAKSRRRTDPDFDPHRPDLHPDFEPIIEEL